MSDNLYESDVLAWSEQQAALLRRAGRGERVNGLDWTNLSEEIEDVGRSQLNSVECLLSHALVHLLKIHGWPDCDAVPHWRAEVIGFLADAARRFAPSMRQRIDPGALYRGALAQARIDRIDGRAPRTSAETCPFTLDELLCDEPDIAALVERLAAPGG